MPRLLYVFQPTPNVTGFGASFSFLAGCCVVMCVSCVLMTVCRLCCCCCFAPGAKPLWRGQHTHVAYTKNLPLWAVYVCLQVWGLSLCLIQQLGVARTPTQECCRDALAPGLAPAVLPCCVACLPDQRSCCLAHTAVVSSSGLIATFCPPALPFMRCGPMQHMRTHEHHTAFARNEHHTGSPHTHTYGCDACSAPGAVHAPATPILACMQHSSCPDQPHGMCQAAAACSPITTACRTTTCTCTTSACLLACRLFVCASMFVPGAFQQAAEQQQGVHSTGAFVAAGVQVSLFAAVCLRTDRCSCACLLQSKLA